MKWPLALGFDFIFLALMLVLIGPPAVAVYVLVMLAPLPAATLVFLSPVLAVLFLGLLCLMAGAVRSLLPRLQRGTYAFPGHRHSVAWLAHFALMRIMNFRLWQGILFSFAGLRWLMLRALGGKVAFGIQTSSDAMLTDPSLVEIGPGSMLAAGSLISCHFIENGQLQLAPVRLGRGVQVMGGVALAPGVTIGDDSVIGPGSKFLPQVSIGDDVYIGMGSTLYNGVRIGSNAVLGHEVTLENDVVVGEGAVVAPGSRVPKGTVIDDGASYPPRAARRGDAAPVANP